MRETVTTKIKYIKKDDYLKLMGLLSMVDDHMKTLVDLEKAILSIVGGEFNDGGHVGDAIYGFDAPRKAKDLLERMNIKVKK